MHQERGYESETELGLIRGTIISVSADNLGASAIGGFKEGAMATHGCRQCMCTVDEFSYKVFNIIKCVRNNKI